MPIKQITPTAEFENYLAGRIENMRKALLRELAAIGEEVVNVARTNGSYTDRTGNLRSSIGYVIVVDGDVVMVSDFKTVKNGAEGAQGGRDYALSLAKNFPKDVALIVVAGMNYAVYVSARGFDVVDSAELQADKLVPEMLQDLGLK